MIKFAQVLLLFYTTVITYVASFNISLDGQTVTNRADNAAVCRFRDWPYLYPPNELWRYLTGGYCYFYTQPERLNFKLGMGHFVVSDVMVPYTMVNNQTIFFDYLNEEYVDLIAPSFKIEKYLNLWKECSQSGEECCADHLNADNVYPTEEYPCPALWDSWACWPAAKPGGTVYRTCPKHIYTSEEIVCTLQSEKYCNEDGWNQDTNYAPCASAPIFRRRHKFHMTVLIVSTVITFPAIVIFYIFIRNQKHLRHILHRNLIIAIVLKNIFTIISKDVIIFDALRSVNETNNIMNNNGVGCRVLTFFDNVATTSVFTCMFLVGFYLHKSIARIFSKEIHTYAMYSVTVACSILPSLIWAISMGATGQQFCWVVDTRGFHWITDTYKYTVLVVNLILLLDIIRVIWLKRLTLNAKQTKSAVKATLVLIPLFGLPLLITSQSSLIDHESCMSGDIYYYIAYTVEALQGVVVALLFCYLNKEIHLEMRKAYRKWIININSRYGTNFNVPSQARATVMTNLRSSGVTDSYRKSGKEKNIDWSSQNNNATPLPINSSSC